jgi:uncharacterized membrane protein YcfT
MVWMDVIRGAAILMVILYHTETQISSNVDGLPAFFTIMNDALGPFRMPLLMMLSGVLLPVSLARPAGVYVKGKLAKIGWPYLLWSFAFLGLLAATSKVTGKSFDPAEFGKIIVDPLSHLWYLAYLLVFYIVCLLIPAKWHVYLIPASIAGAMLVADNSWEKMLVLFAFFLFGEVLARNWVFTKEVVAHPPFVAGCIAVTLVVATLAVLHVISGYEPLLAPLIACSLFAAMPLAKWLVPTQVGKLLGSIGRQSIVFYVSHFLTLIVAFNILSRTGMENAAVLSVVLPATCLLAGFVLVLSRRTAVGGLLFELPLPRGKRMGMSRQPSLEVAKD